MQQKQVQIIKTVYKIVVATIESTRVIMVQIMYNQNLESFSGFDSTI